MAGDIQLRLLTLCAILTTLAALTLETVTKTGVKIESRNTSYDLIRQYLARRAGRKMPYLKLMPFFPRVGASRTRESDLNSLEDEHPQLAEDITDGVVCSPLSTVVKVPELANAYTIPQYVLVNRCVGGCLSYEHGCEANSTKTKNITVWRSLFSGLSYTEKIQIEEHTSCTCGCLVKPSNCTADIHSYDELNCRCDCRNQPRKCPSGMRWDHDACSCTCSKVILCNPGYQFNNTSCSCASACG